MEDSRPVARQSSPNELDLQPLKTPSHLDQSFASDAGFSDDEDVLSSPTSVPSRPPSIDMSRLNLPNTALTALQFLPMPTIVLSSLKTVLIANEAMGRLLKVNSRHKSIAESRQIERGADVLVGQSISKLNIEMMSGPNPVYLDWESFLEEIGQEDVTTPMSPEDGDVTPTNPFASNLSRSVVTDISVDIRFSPLKCLAALKVTSAEAPVRSSEPDIMAHMIVSSWWTDDSRYYTLTFARAQNEYAPKAPAKVTRSVRNPTLHSPTMSSASSDSSSSAGRHSNTTSQSSSNIFSPATTDSTFPSYALPTKSNVAMASETTRKITTLRGALLNAMNLPCFAIWKDESVGVPNEALLRLGPRDIYRDENDGRNFLLNFEVFAEDFTRMLEFDEFPIVKLLRSQKSSSGSRFGLKVGKQEIPRVFEVNCECVHDEETKEFLGGYVIMKDVTEYFDKLNAQKVQTNMQFEYVAQKISQLVWTTKANGVHDWFNDRWYEYTGLTEAQSHGDDWLCPFHPDDLVVTNQRWAHSLATGDEFSVIYRCKRRDGVYRWFLGKALPLRDENGIITRWFGTCTDIHETVQAREHASRTREQLLRVIETAKITLWTIDLDKRITMMEGSLSWDDGRGFVAGQNVIGKDIYEVFDRFKDDAQTEAHKNPIEDILSGRSTDESTEMQVKRTGRWYKIRYVPLLNKTRNSGIEGEQYVDGVIGVVIDYTGKIDSLNI